MNNKYYTRDAAGVYHYKHRMIGTVYGAAELAIKHRPSRPAWFWFNGSYAPMIAGDTMQDLAGRWMEWRQAYQDHEATPTSLLNVMARFSGVRP